MRVEREEKRGGRIDWRKEKRGKREERRERITLFLFQAGLELHFTSP